ncbi:zinc finger CCCH domain-containing protein [Pimephales promelas]|nr:zinc finger CCCH domain-containing protein [Pimephales promelas]
MHVDFVKKAVVATSEPGKMLEEERKHAEYIKKKEERLKMVCSAVKTVFLKSNNSLSRAAKPAVVLSAGGEQDQKYLKCVVHGFYPNVIRVRWTRKGRPVYFGVSSTGILPHRDGTFQMTSYLSLINMSAHDVTCETQHLSLDGILRKTYGASAPTNSRARQYRFATVERPVIGSEHKLGGATSCCKILAAIFTKVICETAGDINKAEDCQYIKTFSQRVTDAPNSGCGEGPVAFLTIMAFVSLFSSPPSPALAKNMTDCELTGEEREDGELEDGEIDDEGISIEEVKETKEESEAVEKDKEKVKDEKSHRHSRKRHRKIKEKRRLKRRRRDRQKHHSPSSGSSSDSYDSEHEHQERPKSKKSKGTYRDHDSELAQRENEPVKPPRSMQHKNSDLDKYSDYSEEKYDYDDEDDFSEELSKYKHAKESSGRGRGGPPRDQAKRPIMKGQQQQFGGQRGRGRGALGRGRGMPNKNKKQKGKNWGRGRGRGGEQGGGDMQESKSPPSFQKKRPIMSQEFINQHTVEHNGRHICKYFLEDRCIKILNTDEETVNEDEMELADLRKQGIAPLPKPPPGVGLLPTPGPGSPPDGGKKIPSLFEIKVQPTVDLAQKIALRPNFYNSASPPAGQFQGGPQFGSSPEDMQTGNMMSSPPNPSHPPHPGSIRSPPLPFTGPGMPQSPPGQPPPQGFGQCSPMPPPGQPPPFHVNMQHMNHPPLNHQGAPFQPVPDMQMKMPFPNMGQMPSEFFKNLFSSQSLAQGDEGPIQDSQPHGNTNSSGMQDFLPAVQKVLLLHLNQNKQDSDSHRDEGCGQGSAPPNREKDETPNWYSSDEEEGSSVTAIINSLKKQNDMLKNQTSTPPADPRLQKERSLPGDPRIKTDPRQRPPDPRKDAGDGVGDPRLARDPRKMKPMDASKPDAHRHPNPSRSHKPPTGEDDEEFERELRERAALIPLDPSPGATLRDPRCQIKPFSHIRVDILLQRPAFAQTVVWAPEDLIPLLIPKQEHSINLPLPPLIADAQLNRTLSSPPDHPPSATPSPPDQRLAAARFKEGVSRLGSPPGRTGDSRHHHPDKPLDPRTHKTLDPRISRSGSLDSKPPGVTGGGDPRLQRGSSNQPAKPDSEKLPPYAPRLASSISAGLDSPTTLLSGISLYDPRNHSLLSPKRESEEQPKKSSILKLQGSPPHASPSQGAGMEKDENSPVDDSESNASGCTSNPPPVATVMPASPCSPAPAVHNLPIQALAGLIRPAYTDPRQNKPVGSAGGTPQEDEDDKDSKKKDRPLRDVFKTFDPTASPFCQ